MILRLILIVFLLLAISGSAMTEDQLGGTAMTEMQKNFAEAYNRGDAEAMAAAFTENAVRVTPTGIFQGREAIRRGFQDALKLGLHDYSVQRVISHSEGPFVFNIGTWQAKLADQPFHGFYSAILVRDGDQPKIMEETVTVAVP